MIWWDLPEATSVGGIAQSINADFRDILDIISWLGNVEEDEQTRVYVALSLFYNEFGSIQEKDYPDAARQLYWFINGGEMDDSSQTQVKTIDWEQDRFIIVADINKVAGCEVRALPFCHWWTFLSWFNGIGEGQLSTVVSIREKRRKGKKLTDWENDFYKNNREKINFKTKYTQNDNAVLNAWTGRKG